MKRKKIGSYIWLSLWWFMLTVDNALSFVDDFGVENRLTIGVVFLASAFFSFVLLATIALAFVNISNEKQ